MRWLRDRFRLREDRGQTVIFVAAALPVLLAAGALVVDGSQLFVNKRFLQNAADAAALAAARDLSTTACGAPCEAAAGKYAGLNEANPDPSGPKSQAPLPACASASSTNCVQNPYKGNPTKLEVRLTRDVPTLFGHIFGLGHDVKARAVGAILPGEPPQLSFGSLNRGGAGCDHHTLVVRSSGIMTVNNNIYVNSCSGTPGEGKGDGFDIFGTGGCVRAKDIFTFGGWETHSGLSVYIPVPATANCSGRRLPPHSWRPPRRPGSRAVRTPGNPCWSIRSAARSSPGA